MIGNSITSSTPRNNNVAVPGQVIPSPEMFMDIKERLGVTSQPFNYNSGAWLISYDSDDEIVTLGEGRSVASPATLDIGDEFQLIFPTPIEIPTASMAPQTVTVTAEEDEYGYVLEDAEEGTATHLHMLVEDAEKIGYFFSKEIHGMTSEVTEDDVGPDNNGSLTGKPLYLGTVLIVAAGDENIGIDSGEFIIIPTEYPNAISFGGGGGDAEDPPFTCKMVTVPGATEEDPVTHELNMVPGYIGVHSVHRLVIHTPATIPGAGALYVHIATGGAIQTTYLVTGSEPTQDIGNLYMKVADVEVEAAPPGGEPGYTIVQNLLFNLAYPAYA